MNVYFLCCLLSLWGIQIGAETVTLVSSAPDHTSIQLHMALDDKQILFHDSIQFSINSPALSIQEWHTNQTAEKLFDPVSHADHAGYQGSLEFILTLTVHEQSVRDATLFFQYLTSTSREMQEQRFLIQGTAHESVSVPARTSAVAQTLPQQAYKHGVPSTLINTPQTLQQMLYEGLHALICAGSSFFTTARQGVSQLLTSTSSRSLQIALAFFLGMLMSLTPCIYPMIPVTVGLLGTSSGNSFVRNLLLASSYTIGLACTFAALGFATVLFGVQCGRLFCNPWFVVILIAFLAYSAGSMFGWYEMYIPRILRPSAQVKRGSLVSAFFFGSASGLIASPCMSPGLALILSVVATLGSYVQGFLLLFAFGVGSSMPLLVIGTFSGSLHLLPRAGMWMNEVKKLFGFLLFMICFYYLQNIVPLHYALWGAALFIVVCGSVYLGRIITASSWLARWYAFLVSVALLSSGLYTAYVGTLAWFASTQAEPVSSPWLHDYVEARIQAQDKKQLLLLDFTASWCSLCVLLDKNVLRHVDVAPVFSLVTAIKIDGSSASNTQYAELTKKFSILGLPTLLLIDPETEQVRQSWNSALLERAPHEFTQEIRAVVQEYSSKPQQRS